MSRILLLALLLMSGCATTSTILATDTFCLTAKKKTWSIDDTAETIRAARVHNLVVDQRCGKPEAS